MPINFTTTLTPEVTGGVSFGSLTAISAGGTSIAESDGTYGEFTVASGVISPNTTPLTPGDVTVGSTTVSVVANEYSVATGAELASAFSAARSADTGSTIRCRGGNYGEIFDTDLYKNVNGHANRITIAAHDFNNKPIFARLHCKNWQMVTFDGLEVTSERTGGLVFFLNDSGETEARRLIIQNCSIHGVRSPGGVTTDFNDPTPLTTGSGGIGDWPSQGITTETGTSGPIHVEIRDNEIYYVKKPITLVGVQTGGTADVIGNNIHHFLDDCAKAPHGATSRFRFNWNKLSYTLQRVGDFGQNLHPDFLQWAGGANDSMNIELIGNQIFQGDTRASGIQVFFADDYSGLAGLNNVLVVGNISHAGMNAPTRLQHAKNVTAHDNVHFFPENYGGTPLFVIGNDVTGGTHVLRYNVAGSVISASASSTGDNADPDRPSTATVTQNNNYNARGNYSTEFVGPPDGDFNRHPETFDDLMTWFATKSGGTLHTANADGGPLGANNPRIDYVNRTYTPLA